MLCRLLGHRWVFVERSRHRLVALARRDLGRPFQIVTMRVGTYACSRCSIPQPEEDA
jgi:hypothetical protein